MASANYAQISLSEVYQVASFPYKKVKKISPRRSTGVLVCWLVRWFVRDARCELVIPRKKNKRPIFMKSGTDVRHICQILLATFQRSRSTFNFKVKIASKLSL